MVLQLRPLVRAAAAHNPSATPHALTGLAVSRALSLEENMDWTSRREAMRAALTGEQCLYPASVFDAISARLAQDVGFEVAQLGGSIASLAVLGAPDLIVLTLTELAELALRINRAASLPLLVDADHGYGNALNVRRTVEELEIAGVAALTIEDTLLPVPYGAVDALQLISLDEGVGKMRAALDARQDPSLVVIGRTSAMQVGGLDETIHRGKAYEAAGVDALVLIGVTTRDQLDAIAGELSVPICLGQTPPQLADLDYLSSRGVRIALQGHLPFMAMVRAVHEVLQALRAGTPPAEIGSAAAPALVKSVSRDAEYQAWLRDFMAGA
jgi:oxaloacetate decarboxylase